MNSLESQFYEAIGSLLMISKILICAPIGLQKPPNQLNHYLIYQKCLQIVWSLIIYVAIALGSYHEYFVLQSALPTVEFPFYLSETVLDILQVLQIMIASYFQRKTFIFFLKFITDFDTKLKDFKMHVHYKDLRKFLRNHLLFNFVFFICSTILGYIERSESLFGFLSLTTSYTLPNLIIQTFLIQYYVFIYVINKRMQLMYQLIEQTLKQTLTENVFHVQRKLRVLRGLYADMEDYIKHLNETFSISILLRFMASLSSLSFYIFYIYKYLVKLTNPEDIWAAFSIIEICMQFSRIFLILHFNQGVQNEKKRAAVLFTTFRCIMERLEPTINRFIMQLSAHPRNHIIYGIIPLNMNIMMTMFVVVSTLFIFLVQYDITYEALMNAGKRT